MQQGPFVAAADAARGQPFEPLLCLFDVRVTHQDAELVAADQGRDVCRAYGFGEQTTSTITTEVGVGL